MIPNQALMQETSDVEENKYEEEWLVIMNTKGQYTLSKIQAQILQQAIAQGNRGIIMFKTFSIPIPYIAEFYRLHRFLKNTRQLPAQATEEEYVPIPEEKWEALRKKIHAKVGNLDSKGGENI